MVKLFYYHLGKHKLGFTGKLADVSIHWGHPTKFFPMGSAASALSCPDGIIHALRSLCTVLNLTGNLEDVMTCYNRGRSSHSRTGS